MPQPKKVPGGSAPSANRSPTGSTGSYKLNVKRNVVQSATEMRNSLLKQLTERKPKTLKKFDTTPVRRLHGSKRKDVVYTKSSRLVGAVSGALAASSGSGQAAHHSSVPAPAETEKKDGASPKKKESLVAKQRRRRALVKQTEKPESPTSRKPEVKMSAFAEPTTTIKAGRSNVASHMNVYQAPLVPRAHQFEELSDEDILDDDTEELDLSRLDPNYERRQQLLADTQLSPTRDETKSFDGLATGTSVYGTQRSVPPRPARVPRLNISGANDIPATVSAGRLDTPQRVQVSTRSIGRTPRRVDTGATISDPIGLKAKTQNTGDGFGKALATEPVKMNNSDNNGLGGVPSVEASASTTIKDYETLAFACRRAGKPYQEGLAYYNMGVLCDNKCQYKKAIGHYQKYARICRRLRHAWGEAVACNHIGVNYQFLGGRYVSMAIEYHLRHVELANESGKFIAYCNLGLCYSNMGDNDNAQANFRNALRFAVRVSNKAGESMVVANMAKADHAHGDTSTARASTERQLALAAQLKDQGGQKDAVQKLGELANKDGDFESAERYFMEARVLATQTKDRQLANSALMHLGLVEGNRQMSKHMTEVAKQLESFHVTTES